MSSKDIEIVDVYDLIEENYDSSCEDENCDPKSKNVTKKMKRSSSRTETQLQLLKSNVPKKSLSLTDKNIVWQSLSSQLNKMGPPHRTCEQWKKLWSEYKSKEKKRNTSNEGKFQITSYFLNFNF